MARNRLLRWIFVALAAGALAGCSSSNPSGSDEPATTAPRPVAHGDFEPAKADAALLLPADQIGGGFTPDTGPDSTFFGDYQSMVNLETTQNSLATASGGTAPPANELPDRFFGKNADTGRCPLDLPEASAFGLTSFRRGATSPVDSVALLVWVYPDAATAKQAAARMVDSARKASDPLSACAGPSQGSQVTTVATVDDACGVGDTCFALSGGSGARCRSEGEGTSTTIAQCTTSDTAVVSKGNVVVTSDIELWNGNPPLTAVDAARLQLTRLV